ncbi:MAG TPA: hypothetical protein VFK02_07180 [Kofleriaceae bacterium]|nr:hypothetical protein [Kofleriaceae bacterium]
MRRALVVIALVASSCTSGSAAPSHPAWPNQRPREVDGGESLAPRAAARAVATVVEDDRPAEKPAADKPAATPSAGAPGGAADKPAAQATPATSPPVDDPITADDIVIEIED